MFTNKSVLACASILFALAAQTSAHAIPNPALGVKGTPKRSDVQRPSTGSPCGSVNIASTLDTSTAIAAAADGTVTFQVQNFNAGADGSTSVAVQVDATGAGKKFVAATVKTNGNKAPSKVESDKVVVSLPAGTKCTGGKAKNLCLLSVKTTAGFGACTVVSQGKAAAAPPAAKPAAAKPAAAKPAAAKPAAPQSIAQLAAKQTSKKTVFETCASDSECQQGCCGFSSGKCAGPDVAQSNGSGGCGRGGAAPNCDVATLLGFKDCVKGSKNGNLNDATVQQAAAFAAQLDNLKFTPNAAAAAPAAAKPAAAKPAAAKPAAAKPAAQQSIAQLAAKQNSKKTVFSTCASDSECQQGCCGFSSGKCAGPDVAQSNGSGGCGHGAKVPNCNVATLLGFSDCVKGSKNGNLHDATIQQAAAFAAKLDNLKFTPSVRRRDLEGKLAPGLMKARAAMREVLAEME
ncbi:hypothetical protein DFH06DRAFT_1329112 [Mycena polygramma]|nr:hypothetical protein DFH06DRAFT_1329112 [Mycena polygramma]